MISSTSMFLASFSSNPACIMRTSLSLIFPNCEEIEPSWFAEHQVKYSHILHSHELSILDLALIKAWRREAQAVFWVHIHSKMTVNKHPPLVEVPMTWLKLEWTLHDELLCCFSSLHRGGNFHGELKQEYNRATLIFWWRNFRFLQPLRKDGKLEKNQTRVWSERIEETVTDPIFLHL